MPSLTKNAYYQAKLLEHMKLENQKNLLMYLRFDNQKRILEHMEVNKRNDLIMQMPQSNRTRIINLMNSRKHKKVKRRK